MKEPLQMEALMVLMIYKLAISQPRLITDGPDARWTRCCSRGTPSVFVLSNPAENR